MHNNNPLRTRILESIDDQGIGAATDDELTEHFRHPNHVANWAALWNLVVTVSLTPGVTMFSRRLTTDRVAQIRDKINESPP